MRIYRVVIVDDSAISREIIGNVIKGEPDMEIAGEASNGADAVNLVIHSKPDLVLMDLHMPVMDGLEAAKQIMILCPVPIVMISAFPYKDGKSILFDALDQGAVDVLEKPTVPSLEIPGVKERLVKQLKMLADIDVAKSVTEPSPAIQVEADTKEYRKIVGIASSTGGPQAIKSILKRLPAHSGMVVIIAQHMTEGFTEGLVEWLDENLNYKVKLAQDQEFIEAGTVYVAPDQKHVEVDASRRLVLIDPAPSHDLYVPSGDRLLSSIARVFGKESIGIVLSGMGSDGAEGLMAMKEAKAMTIAQDEASCVVFGMPKAAIEKGAVCSVLSLDQIGQTLLDNLEVGVSS